MRSYVAAVAVLLALAGCVRSIHPLYTEADLVFDRALLGTWEPAEQNGKEQWDFRKADGNSYILVHTGKNGRKARLTAHLLELKNHRFLDLTLRKPKKGNNLKKLHSQPVHSYLRVESMGPRLRLTPMNPKWLKGYLKEHPDALDYENPEDAPAVLTSSTERLQEFVLEHMDNADAWGGTVGLRPVDRD